MHLVIGEKSPSYEGLKPAFNQSKDKDFSNNTQYLISKDILNNEFFWLDTCYSKPKPYNDKSF